MAGIILAYITNPSEDEARRIAKHLLDRKLIACANIFPITSMYRWEGEVKDDKEFVMLCKTTEGHFEELQDEVGKIHKYDVPCIIRLEAGCNDLYSNWVEQETSLQGPG